MDQTKVTVTTRCKWDLEGSFKSSECIRKNSLVPTLTEGKTKENNCIGIRFRSRWLHPNPCYHHNYRITALHTYTHTYCYTYRYLYIPLSTSTWCKCIYTRDYIEYKISWSSTNWNTPDGILYYIIVMAGLWHMGIYIYIYLSVIQWNEKLWIS